MKQLKNQPKCALGRVMRGHVPFLGGSIFSSLIQRNKESKSGYRQGESGRSMVEMLGVLAIIGVLSVGGIAGYTTAMNKHRANKILNGASVRAIVVSTQIQRGSAAPTLGEFTDADNAVGGATFTGLADWNKDTDKRFSLTLTGVNEDICTQMKAMIGENGIIREIDDGCTTITYNNDLTATTFITDNKDSTSCESAGGAWDEATKTCGCPGRYTGSNCEVAPTSCPSGTTRTEDGKCKYCIDESQCMECEMGDEILDSGYYVLVAECYNPKTENAKCGDVLGSVTCLKCSKPETPYVEYAGMGCYNPKTQNINCSRYTCKTCEKNSDTPDVFCTENACTCYNSKTQNVKCGDIECTVCDKDSTIQCGGNGVCSCVAK